MELGLQLALAAGRLPSCWALTPVHSQSTSGRGGIHAVLSKGNRTCLLSARSCCSTARLEHSPCPVLCSAFPLLQHLFLHSLPRTSTAHWPEHTLPARHLWCVGHGADKLLFVPPKSSSTPLLPGRARRVSSWTLTYTDGVFCNSSLGS